MQGMRPHEEVLAVMVVHDVVDVSCTRALGFAYDGAEDLAALRDGQPTRRMLAF